MEDCIVIAVSKSKTHTFNKFNCDQITVIAELGVQGDAHLGRTVKHRSRVAKDPSQPNLRQVHLIPSELFQELAEKGFAVNQGAMGENITTRGIALLNLPKNTILKIGANSEIQITGLRNPCSQIDTIQKGLMKAVLDKDVDGNLIKKAGVMGIVLKSGKIKIDDKIEIQLPQKPYIKLEVV